MEWHFQHRLSNHNTDQFWKAFFNALWCPETLNTLARLNCLYKRQQAHFIRMQTHFYLTHDKNVPIPKTCFNLFTTSKCWTCTATVSTHIPRVVSIFWMNISTGTKRGHGWKCWDHGLKHQKVTSQCPGWCGMVCWLFLGGLSCRAGSWAHVSATVSQGKRSKLPSVSHTGTVCPVGAPSPYPHVNLITS